MPFAAIRDTIEHGLAVFFGWLPALLGALAILVVGYIVARVVGRLVARLLGRAGLDRALLSGQGGNWLSKVTTSPSRLIGRFTFWALFLGAVSLAVTALGIDALTDFMGAVYGYLPNVVAAVLIFLVAGAIAAAVGTLVQRTMGDTPTGRVLRTVVPALVMAIAVFMILNQLRIAPVIVTITYAAIIGGFALAAALAFGLGGRDVAARMLEGAYEKGQEQREQVRGDLETGRERGRQLVAEATERRAQAPTQAVVRPGATMRR